MSLPIATILRTRPSMVLAALLALAACGGSKKSGGPAGTSRTVTGTATYDFVPASLAAGLDFAGAVQAPIRNATVVVAAGTTVLNTASARTDASGRFSVTFNDPGGTLSLVVLAETTTPKITVQDNTDGQLWALGVPLAAGATVQNVHATHGWTGASYDAGQRTAAPFAILDSMYVAAQAFIAVRPAVGFPALVVNWSPNNVPQSGGTGLSGGFIGTSHFNPGVGPPVGQIFILGKDGVDTDEFDDHVIVHEWGHYFEHNLSRSDSIGGPHSLGDILDPRVAFGEGYGDGIAAILLQAPIYVDTQWAGPGGAMSAFGWDTENDPGDIGGTTDDPNKSVFSEASVMRFLYDLWDPGSNEAWDGAALGLGPIYDVLTGPEKSTDALTTVGSFIAGLKAQAGVNAAAVDALAAHYNIGPITDAFGTGDANLAAMYLPMALNSGTPYSMLLTGGYTYNKWYQNQYFVITGNGAQVTVTASSVQNVALAVYQAGTQVTAADANTSGTETVHFNTTSGKKYVVNLVGFSATAADYGVSLDFTSP